MYKLKLIYQPFVCVKSEYGRVDVDIPLKFNSLDDVFNVIGYMLAGREGQAFRFEIEEVKENKDAE